MKKTMVLVLVLVVVLGVALAACGAPASSVAGLWYEETGYGGTLELKSNGKCTQKVMGFSLDGSYTFDEATGAGEVTVEFWGEKTTTAFTFSGDKLVMDGANYTKTEVEQKSLDDAFGEMGDALKDLENVFQN